MDSDIHSLVSHIHASSGKAVVAVTGGGASAVSWLLAVPGASRTILEAVVPYAQESLDAWLGGEPESYCSASTARQMARRARDRAAWLAPGASVAGIACTASLRSDRPKKGEHRVHVAAATATGCFSHSLTLAKEQRQREGEEQVCGRLLLNALAEAFGLPDRVELGFLPGEEILTAQESTGLLPALLRGAIESVCLAGDGRLHTDRPTNLVLLPGSFNPLHHGHLGMVEVAARRTGRPTAFELSVSNPDKGLIDIGEVRRRAAQFTGRALWLTRAATFDEKARLFPGTIFVVGADTAARIVQTRFYRDSVVQMREALNAIRGANCRFLVAGRTLGSGAFLDLEALEIPEEFRDLFESIGADEFRVDVSSTTLRG